MPTVHLGSMQGQNQKIRNSSSRQAHHIVSPMLVSATSEMMALSSRPKLRLNYKIIGNILPMLRSGTTTQTLCKTPLHMSMVWDKFQQIAVPLCHILSTSRTTLLGNMHFKDRPRMANNLAVAHILGPSILNIQPRVMRRHRRLDHLKDKPMGYRKATCLKLCRPDNFFISKHLETLPELSTLQFLLNINILPRQPQYKTP